MAVDSALVAADTSVAEVEAGAVRATTDRRGWRRWLRRRPVLTGLVALALAGAGVGAWAVVAASSSGYELSTAAPGNVQQTLDLTATIEPVNEATVDFQVSGKVATVDVTAGQTVTSGEVLASLDSSSLQAAVTEDQSELSADQDKLSSDEESESSDPSSSDSSTGTSSLGSSSTGSSSTGSGSPSSGSIASQIASAQQQLVADQHTADTVRTQETGDLQNAN
ncbi:MAG TPA: biotin/lipoyl-binding protein, partial [Acidimicrobiales bacterium]|nr:biotin/lipoyl-binding protein [Acidimicrobiales bacterium]